MSSTAPNTLTSPSETEGFLVLFLKILSTNIGPITGNQKPVRPSKDKSSLHLQGPSPPAPGVMSQQLTAKQTL